MLDDPLLSTFWEKLLGTGVEFHSQFIQVCLSAIKTRQPALIFYTRRDSQKAITHKFLIIFCLLASITTRSNRGRVLRCEKLFARFNSTVWTIMEGEVVCILLVKCFRIFKLHITNKKRQIWFRTMGRSRHGLIFYDESWLGKGGFLREKLVLPITEGHHRVRRLVEYYYIFLVSK